MEKTVIVSPRFHNKTLRIYSYLLQEFSAKTAYEFLEKLEKRVDLISKHPYVGRPSRKKAGVRSAILSPHNRIYYRLQNSKIFLLTIIDMRRDNSSNPY